MSDTNTGDDSRGNALLTTGFREYLQTGPLENKDSDRTTRQRLRDRLRAGLMDFRLIGRELDARDRRQLAHDDPENRLVGIEPERALRMRVVEGILYMLAFGYVLLLELNADIEEYLAFAIELAHKDILDDPHTERDIQVAITNEPRYDITAIVSKLQNGEDLSDDEYYFLRRYSVQDTEAFLTATADIDIQLDDAIESDTRLTRGKSLLVFWRALPTTSEYDPDTIRRVLDPQVASEFNLPHHPSSNRASDTDAEEYGRLDEPDPEDVADEL